MKKITAKEIPAKFLFILETYGALDNYLGEINQPYWLYGEYLCESETFNKFISGSFLLDGTLKKYEYWCMICNQDEPAIRAYNNIQPVTLFQLYELARDIRDYKYFESLIKSTLVGLPVTQTIEGEVVISLKK